MANRESRLQGFTDPSVPGWEKRALDAVKGRQKKSHRNNERQDGMILTFDMECKALVDEAASRRGISMAGYGRRALAAMLAYDLGMPITEVLQYMSKPTPYRQYGAHGRPLVRLNDDGQDYGKWVIKGLDDVPDL